MYVCMCVIVVTMWGWADVGLWVAVCFLAKISSHRPTYKTTFARLTQSQAILQSFRVFISFRSMRDTTFFSLLKTLFYTNLPFPLPWWWKDLLVDKHARGGQSTSKSTCQIPAWTLTAFGDRSASSMSKERLVWTLNPEMIPFGTKSVTLLSMLIDLVTSMHTCRSTQGEDLYWFDRINWPLTSRDAYLFGNACAGPVWRQFRCLRLSKEACGAPRRLAILLSSSFHCGYVA